MARIAAIALSLFMFGMLPARAQTPAPENAAAIAAVVNGDAITQTDVNDRTRLVMASSNMPDSDQLRDRLKPQIVNMLVDETLVKQETAQLKLAVTDAEVDKNFADLAAQNKMSAGQFQDMLRQSGVPEAAVRSQIRGQLSMLNLVKAKIRPQITITDAQVDAQLAKARENIGKPEYLLAEIYLPVETAQQDGDVRQLALKLVSELAQRKGPFSAAAAQFSQSSSASKGGDMGWMQGDQLAPEIEQFAAQAKPVTLSPPIRTLTGYYIVLLRDRRDITAATMPSRDDIRQTIGMSALDRLQRRYMLDLKSTAFIERRAS